MTLSEIAFRSKATWGYEADFMEKCREKLTISEDFIKTNPCYCVESGNTRLGFYSL